MRKRKLPWQYSNADTHRCGTMQCTMCGKEIEQGEFRYREAYDDRGFHAHQHRACVPEDQHEYWHFQEDKARAHKARNAQYLEACKAFRDLWNTAALDDEIAELESP